MSAGPEDRAAAAPAGAAPSEVAAYLRGLQARIVDALEAVEAQAAVEVGTAGAATAAASATAAAARATADAVRFLRDGWQKAPGEPLQGSGLTCILEGGRVFERAGCGFSQVTGPRLPPSATQHRPELAGAAFEAMGVSLVFHPRNPLVPIVHMNVRMLAALPEGQPPVCWFGGGMDLTPCYGFEEDAVHFHRACRDSLAAFGDDKYPRFKAWCDDYFVLKHRREQRGIGGIFFDDFSELGEEGGFAMLRSVGDAFLGAYLPIVERRRFLPYGEREREFQLYRRGRYVEFNLVWDRGTHFGLQSGGRTESILLSMPPLACWAYQREPEAGSREAALYSDFIVRREWL